MPQPPDHNREAARNTRISTVSSVATFAHFQSLSAMRKEQETRTPMKGEAIRISRPVHMIASPSSCSERTNPAAARAIPAKRQYRRAMDVALFVLTVHHPP